MEKDLRLVTLCSQYVSNIIVQLKKIIDNLRLSDELKSVRK